MAGLLAVSTGRGRSNRPAPRLPGRPGRPSRAAREQIKAPRQVRQTSETVRLLAHWVQSSLRPTPDPSSSPHASLGQKPSLLSTLGCMHSQEPVIRQSGERQPASNPVDLWDKVQTFVPIIPTVLLFISSWLGFHKLLSDLQGLTKGLKLSQCQEEIAVRIVFDTAGAVAFPIIITVALVGISISNLYHSRAVAVITLIVTWTAPAVTWYFSMIEARKLMTDAPFLLLPDPDVLTWIGILITMLLALFNVIHQYVIVSRYNASQAAVENTYRR